MNKRVVSLVCILVLLLSMCIPVLADSDDGLPWEYKEYRWRDFDSGSQIWVTKPRANYEITVTDSAGNNRYPGRTISPYSSSEITGNSPEIYNMAYSYDMSGNLIINNMGIIKSIDAYVGDTLSFRDCSVVGSGSSIDLIDFQWQAGVNSGTLYSTVSAFNSKTITLTPDMVGKFSLYYNVRDNKFAIDSGYLGNWSENGCHVTWGHKNPDFEPEGMYWYYTRFDINVLASDVKLPTPDFTIQFNGNDVTDKSFEIESFPCTVTLTDASDTSNGSTISSYKWLQFSNSEIAYKTISGTGSSVTYTINESEVGSNGEKYFALRRKVMSLFRICQK